MRWKRPHRGIGGSGPGRLNATQQVNQAYAVFLASQFQGYCRDLHEECAQHFVQTVSNAQLREALRNALLFNRKLKSGNANSGNIGEDFNRFGFLFWGEVKARSGRSEGRRVRLEQLNTWRNAIAPNKCHGEWNYEIHPRL